METIKAIETEWDGYRFRSRLEARWAVFLKSLGIVYEYEKEGFDLGDGIKYLPDFWLPKQEVWLEIKPLLERTEVRSFYLAGKVCEGDDWRSALIGLGNHSWYRGGRNRIRGGDLYRGPHYDAQHGAQYGHIAEPETETTKQCRSEIDRSDIVFVWIDEPARYGTVAEVGYAIAKNKPVFVAFGNMDIYAEYGETYEDLIYKPWSYKDYWFIAAMAVKWGRFPNAETAFAEWFGKPTYDSEEEKCRRLSSQARQVILVRGDPYLDSYEVSGFAEGERWYKGGTLGCSRNGDGLRLDILERGWHYRDTHEHLVNAYSTARTARFEHGQAPAIPPPPVFSAPRIARPIRPLRPTGSA